MCAKPKDFCYECRKETTYTLQKRAYVKEVNGILRTFLFTAAICDNCGKEIGIPGIIDQNILEFQSQLQAERNENSSQA